MKDLFLVGRLRLPGHNPPLVSVYEHAAAAAVCVAHVEVILVAAAGLALAQNLDTEYQILALKYNKVRRSPEFALLFSSFQIHLPSFKKDLFPSKSIFLPKILGPIKIKMTKKTCKSEHLSKGYIIYRNLQFWQAEKHLHSTKQ